MSGGYTGGMLRSTLLGGLAFGLLASCAQPARQATLPADAPSPVPATAEAEEPVVLGDVLIWPVRYGRAEDLAITLQPFLERRFGPGVRVVPHVPTNRLLVHVPSWRERQAQRMLDRDRQKQEEAAAELERKTRRLGPPDASAGNDEAGGVRPDEPNDSNDSNDSDVDTDNPRGSE